MRGELDLSRRSRRGFMTTELMVVAIVLAILSGIATSAVPTFASRAKRSALASTLSVLQGATDRYYVEANAYPAASQPVATTKAVAISNSAQDPNGLKFVGAYLHSTPNSNPVDYGLSITDGATVHFGITAGGRVFATQEAPTTGEWAAGTAEVFTQENCESIALLSTIW
jgi:Tfp pilus assembly protein PilE